MDTGVWSRFEKTGAANKVAFVAAVRAELFLMGHSTVAYESVVFAELTPTLTGTHEISFRTEQPRQGDQCRFVVWVCEKHCITIGGVLSQLCEA